MYWAWCPITKDKQCVFSPFDALTPTLSRREREFKGQQRHENCLICFKLQGV